MKHAGNTTFTLAYSEYYECWELARALQCLYTVQRYTLIIGLEEFVSLLFEYFSESDVFMSRSSKYLSYLTNGNAISGYQVSILRLV